jgi:GTPase involved in cell partitioning and DNA repair
MINELADQAFWRTPEDQMKKDALRAYVKVDDYRIVKPEVDEARKIQAELHDYVDAELRFKAEILELDKMDEEEQEEAVEEFIDTNRVQYLDDVTELIRTWNMVKFVLEYCKEYEKEPPKWLVEAKEELQFPNEPMNEHEFCTWADGIMNGEEDIIDG